MQVRIFLENITPDEKTSILTIFDEKIIHYLRNVLRFEVGRKMYIFNQENEFECVVESISKKSIQVKMVKCSIKHEILHDLTVFLPILKRDKLSFLTSSLTQLGVKKIIFYKSQHSSNSDKINFDKLDLVVVESLEQCRGFVKTEISPNIVNLQDIATFVQESHLYIAYEKQNNVSDVVIDNIDRKFLLIGPEGGFLQTEIDDLTNRIMNFSFLDLGERILRAEIATIVAIAKIKN